MYISTDNVINLQRYLKVSCLSIYYIGDKIYYTMYLLYEYAVVLIILLILTRNVDAYTFRENLKIPLFDAVTAC